VKIDVPVPMRARRAAVMFGIGAGGGLVDVKRAVLLVSVALHLGVGVGREAAGGRLVLPVFEFVQ